jgi:predicted  nucleic acid-binding Zn-ribbon protein
VSNDSSVHFYQRLSVTEEDLRELIGANAQAINDLRQEILDTHRQLSQAQTAAWEAIAQTNRTVGQVTNNIFQLTQEISRLRSGQEQQQ